MKDRLTEALEESSTGQSLEELLNAQEPDLLTTQKEG